MSKAIQYKRHLGEQQELSTHLLGDSYNNITTFKEGDPFYYTLDGGACLAYLDNDYGQYIIKTGGRTRNVYTNKTMIYDINNNTMSHIIGMNTPRYSHTCLVHPNNTFLYVLGSGAESDTYIEWLDISNYGTDKGWNEKGNIIWKDTAILISHAANARSYPYKHYIFVLGGETLDYKDDLFVDSTIWRYDIIQETLDTDETITGGVRRLDYVVYEAAHVITDTHVYLFGGKNTDGDIDTWQSQQMLSIFILLPIQL